MLRRLRRPPTRYAALSLSSVPPSPATDPLAEHRPFLDAAVANPDDEEPWWLWHDHLLARGHMRLAQLVRHSLLQGPGPDEGSASATWRHTLSARPLDEAPPTFRMSRGPAWGPSSVRCTKVGCAADGRPCGDLGPLTPSAELHGHRVQGRRTGRPLADGPPRPAAQPGGAAAGQARPGRSTSAAWDTPATIHLQGRADRLGPVLPRRAAVAGDPSRRAAGDN